MPDIGDDLWAATRHAIGALWLEAELGEMHPSSAVQGVLDAVSNTLGVECTVEEAGDLVPPLARSYKRFPFRGAAGPAVIVFEKDVPLLVGLRVATVVGRIARIEKTRSTRQLRHEIRNSLAAILANVGYAEMLLARHQGALPKEEGAELQRAISALTAGAHALVGNVDVLTEVDN